MTLRNSEPTSRKKSNKYNGFFVTAHQQRGAWFRGRDVSRLQNVTANVLRRLDSEHGSNTSALPAGAELPRRSDVDDGNAVGYKLAHAPNENVTEQNIKAEAAIITCPALPRISNPSFQFNEHRKQIVRLKNAARESSAVSSGERAKQRHLKSQFREAVV